MVVQSDDNYGYSKVLLQYSGGKDSTACLVKLLKENRKVTAIHFVHKYSYELPTEEARRICYRFNVKLEIIDITEQLNKIFLPDFRLRPCRFCKAIMDSITVAYAEKNGFDTICVGDTKSDSTLVARLERRITGRPLFSRYFNQKVVLPKNISIYRPLLCMSGKEVLHFLAKNGITVQRVQDTGDKYFEYAREGCPLQFKDLGVVYTEELMNALKVYNEACSEFAKLYGIRASVHLPSGFIVTIPKGYEEKCREFLISQKCFLKEKIKNLSKFAKYIIFTVAIYEELKGQEIMCYSLQRLMERLGLKNCQLMFADNNYCLTQGNENLMVSVDNDRNIIYGMLLLNKIPKTSFLENLLIEIYHTYDFTIRVLSKG